MNAHNNPEAEQALLPRYVISNIVERNGRTFGFAVADHSLKEVYIPAGLCEAHGLSEDSLGRAFRAAVRKPAFGSVGSSGDPNKHHIVQRPMIFEDETPPMGALAAENAALKKALSESRAEIERAVKKLVDLANKVDDWLEEHHPEMMED